MKHQEDKKNKSSFKKYKAAFDIAKSNKKIFIFSFLSKLIYLPFTLLVTFFIWYCIYDYLDIKELNGYTLKQIFAYFFTVRIVLYMISFYKQQSYKIWNDINSGDLSRYLCRPISYLKFQLCYSLGYTKYNWLVTLPILFLGAVIINVNHIDLITVVLFILSLLNSIFITFCIYSIIGLVTFWTEAIFGLRELVDHTGSILAGTLIPLEFLPQNIQLISMYTPFRAMVTVPVTIYMSNNTFAELLELLLLQYAWCIILWGALYITWILGSRKYEAQGG